MVITWQTIITVGSAVSVLIAMITIILKLHSWYLRQQGQDKDIKDLKQHHEDDLRRIKDENILICSGLSACLDGLQQLGANHNVAEAKEKLDAHLNKQAHK